MRIHGHTHRQTHSHIQRHTARALPSSLTLVGYTGEAAQRKKASTNSFIVCIQMDALFLSLHLPDIHTYITLIPEFNVFRKRKISPAEMFLQIDSRNKTITFNFVPNLLNGLRRNENSLSTYCHFTYSFCCQ